MNAQGSAVRSGDLVVVGDALLDRDVDTAARRLCPDSAAPVVEATATHSRPGGAALAAHLAARAGHPVTLVAPLGDDAVSTELLDLLDERVRVLPLPWDRAAAEKTRIRAAGQTIVRIDRPANPYTGSPTAELSAALADAGSILVSDYGGGLTHNPDMRRILAGAAGCRPLVWDPHPRGGRCVPGTLLLTPNQSEAAAGGVPELASARGGAAVTAAVRAADRLRSDWSAAQVAVTLGAQGAVLGSVDCAMFVPAPSVEVRDACGAGDCFAVTAAAALRAGALPSEAVVQAVAEAAAFLAAGGVAILAEEGRELEAETEREWEAGRTWEAGRELGPGPEQELRHGPDSESAPDGAQPSDAFRLAASIRSAGGRVAATGGCFDLLHAGHIRTLAAARAAGDCLIVCLNSDESVRRLKGPGRPLNNAADRAAVLAALDCVDGVVVFDETTPDSLLRRLRPDVWVKGGDYSVASLPETELVRSWGGDVVTVPYLVGKSSTRLMAAAGLGG